MRITFDPAKNKANIAGHGVSLAEADNIDWDAIIEEEDIRENYSEVRMVGYAPIGARVFCVVYTPRNGERRIISLRKANRREVTRYASKKV